MEGILKQCIANLRAAQWKIQYVATAAKDLFTSLQQKCYHQPNETDNIYIWAHHCNCLLIWDKHCTINWSSLQVFSHSALSNSLSNWRTFWPLQFTTCEEIVKDTALCIRNNVSFICKMWYNSPPTNKLSMLHLCLVKECLMWLNS